MRLDPRVHAFDPATRRAEAALRGQVEGGGWHFYVPVAAWAGNARLHLKARPDREAPQVTEALPGEALEMLWPGAGDWALVRTAHDRYLGWARSGALVHTPPAGERLRVTAPRAHAFAGPGVSQPVSAELCAGAWLGRAAGEVVITDGRRWVPVLLPDGEEAWVAEVAFAPLLDPDPATFALRLLETPYLWGGRSAWGLDCSGLTQLAYAASSRVLPRDADQQAAFLCPVQAPRRGDLAFFPGHVGVMLGGRRMVHANATHMRVTVETLGEGEYGARLAGELTGFGRWKG